MQEHTTIPFPHPQFLAEDPLTAVLRQQFPEPLEPQSSSRFLVWSFVNHHAIMRLKPHSMAPF